MAECVFQLPDRIFAGGTVNGNILAEFAKPREYGRYLIHSDITLR